MTLVCSRDKLQKLSDYEISEDVSWWGPNGRGTGKGKSYLCYCLFSESVGRLGWRYIMA